MEYASSHEIIKIRQFDWKAISKRYHKNAILNVL